MKKMSARSGAVQAAALFIFSLFLLVGCVKEPPPMGTAHGYFPVDKNGLCGGTTNVHGIWYNGLSTNTDSNYVDISVHVTQAGSYTITSDTVNGAKFSAAGSFGDTGVQIVRLKGAGSFRTPGDAVIPIHFDSSSCQFGISVNDSAGLSLGENMWTFTAEGNTYGGPFTAENFGIPQSSGSDFEFDGSTVTGDTILSIGLFLPDGLSVGPHATSGSSLDGFSFYTTPAGGATKTIYTTSTAAGAVVTFNVLSIVTMITPYFHTITVATFSGTVLTSDGKLVPLTNGKFKWGQP